MCLPALERNVPALERNVTTWSGMCLFWRGMCLLWSGVCLIWRGMCLLWSGMCLLLETPIATRPLKTFLAPCGREVPIPSSQQPVRGTSVTFRSQPIPLRTLLILFSHYTPKFSSTTRRKLLNVCRYLRKCHPLTEYPHGIQSYSLCVPANCNYHV